MKKEFDFDDIGKKHPIAFPKASLRRCSVMCGNVLMAAGLRDIVYG